ncbi:MAG TPA: hypothetical protein VMV94_10220, partial [Phycisphaerae bacterium]|nr:hypothetical protein [Phycisphaerae bacterium]
MDTVTSATLPSTRQSVSALPAPTARACHCCGLGGLLLVIILLAPSVVWIARDRSVWPWDQAWYGEVSVELYRTLRDEPARFWEMMLAALPAKPPGITWLGMWFVPLGQRVFGRIEPALMLSILLCQAVTLLLLLRLGRRLVPGRPLVAMVPCAAVAAAPLFIGMSHQYFAEPLQTLAVAWIFCIAARGREISRLGAVAQLIAAVAIAMLAKVTTPIYCLLPGILAVGALVRKRPTEQPLSRGRIVANAILLLAGLGLAVCALAWYFRNAGHVYEHAAGSSSGTTSLLYGSDRPFLAKMWFWSDALRYSFVAAPLIWVLGAAVAVASTTGLVRAVCRRAGRLNRFDVLTICSVLQVLLVLSLFSRVVNEETRYLLPLVVPLAVILMRVLAAFPDWSLASVLLVLFAGQWAWIQAQTQALIGPGPMLSPWLRTVDPDPTRAGEIDRLVRLTCDERTSGKIHTVGVEYPWFNPNSFSFFAAKAALNGVPRCTYTSLGYAEQSENTAWKRLTEAIRSPYFISIDEAHQPPSDAFNVVSR